MADHATIPDVFDRAGQTGPDHISRESADWRDIVREAIRDPLTLCRELGLPDNLAQQIAASAVGFPLLIPRTLLGRIRPGDPADPVLRQFLPLTAELQQVEGYSDDPLEERSASPAPGILAKYSGRILVLAHPACPVHCRYCFRRAFPYSVMLKDRTPPQPPHGEFSSGREGPLPRLVRSVTAYLERHPDVHEVILSGGEPLLLDDDDLASWLSELGKIPTVRRIRFHTRMPIVIPQRVTDALVQILSSCPKSLVVVLHANHPQEIDGMVLAAIERLRAAKALLLLQSVLLAGINDSADVLAELYETLAAVGVLPYYLHQLDRVSGTHHFEVAEVRGRAIIQQLRERLPGYLVPRYVREVPGAPAKLPLL